MTREPVQDYLDKRGERAAETYRQCREALAGLDDRIADLETLGHKLGTVAFNMRVEAHRLVSFGLRYASADELIGLWCDDGMAPEAREELIALIRSVAAGMSLGEFLEATSARTWWAQHGGEQ